MNIKVGSLYQNIANLEEPIYNKKDEMVGFDTEHEVGLNDIVMILEYETEIYDEETVYKARILYKNIVGWIWFYSDYFKEIK